MPCVFFPTQAIDQSGGVVCVRARHTRRRAQAVIRKRGAPKKKKYPNEKLEQHSNGNKNTLRDVAG